MRIRKIKAYRVLEKLLTPLPPRLQGEPISVFDAVIVELITDTDHVGWGEMAPLGAFYSPAFASGARAGVTELAPYLLGMDPRATTEVGRRLETVMNGQPFVKSALDMACCDLAAKAAGMPLASWLGGRFGESVPLYHPLIGGSPADMADAARAAAERGYDRFQVKIGRVPVPEAVERVMAVRDAVPKNAVVFCDANTAMSTLEAKQFLRSTRTLDYVLEQPCRTLDECAVLRNTTDRPIVLDESVSSLESLLEIHRRGLADGLTLKISRLGGVSKTRTLRDLAVDLGFMVSVEDTGGADVDTAAMVHLSMSTPEERRLHTTAYTEWVAVTTASNRLPITGNRITVSDRPGLGLDIIQDSLGSPFFTVGN